MFSLEDLGRRTTQTDKFQEDHASSCWPFPGRGRREVEWLALFTLLPARCVMSLGAWRRACQAGMPASWEYVVETIRYSSKPQSKNKKEIIF